MNHQYTIHKFNVEAADHLTLEIKGFVRILKVGFQDPQKDGVLSFWVLVDPDATDISSVPVLIRGTGHYISRDDLFWFEHFDTVVGRLFVWHIFLGREGK